MASDNEQSTLGGIVSKVVNAVTPGVDSDGAPKETGDITSLYGYTTGHVYGVTGGLGQP